MNHDPLCEQCEELKDIVKLLKEQFDIAEYYRERVETLKAELVELRKNHTL